MAVVKDRSFHERKFLAVVKDRSFHERRFLAVVGRTALSSLLDFPGRISDTYLSKQTFVYIKEHYTTTSRYQYTFSRKSVKGAADIFFFLDVFSLNLSRFPEGKKKLS